MLLASAALSGCASIFGHGVAERGPAPEAIVQPEVANAELTLARQAMDAGLTAEAIDHFRAAQMDPQALPAASNGLGVAYARLGRLDLADRNFRMALALEPANQRVAANMLRLQRDYALAQAQTAEAKQLAEARQAAQAQPTQAVPPAVAMAERPGELERVSRGEVFIRTARVAAAAPTAQVASRDSLPAPTAIKVASRSVTPRRANNSYPVRIDLAKRVSSAGGEAVAVQYPQRIDLAKVVLID
jgi:tetratricopeptide (TPR) repeat protein